VVVRGSAGPARGGEGRWPTACGTRGRPPEGAGWGAPGVTFGIFRALFGGVLGVRRAERSCVGEPGTAGPSGTPQAGQDGLNPGE
jgi:hypothetical protein